MGTRTDAGAILVEHLPIAAPDASLGHFPAWNAAHVLPRKTKKQSTMKPRPKDE
jgi:hypothetical protein